MDLNRRHLIGASTAGLAGALAMPSEISRAASLTSTSGRDAAHHGVQPGSSENQTQALQRAIDEAARAQVPLALPPGVYRTGMLRLQSGTQLVGVRGATRLVFEGGASFVSSIPRAPSAEIAAGRFGSRFRMMLPWTAASRPRRTMMPASASMSKPTLRCQPM